MQGLTKVELSQAECRELLASIEKTTTDAAMALVLTVIISALVSFRKTQVEASVVESAIGLSKPDPILQETPRIEGKE